MARWDLRTSAEKEACGYEPSPRSGFCKFQRGRVQALTSSFKLYAETGNRRYPMSYKHDDIGAPAAFTFRQLGRGVMMRTCTCNAAQVLILFCLTTTELCASLHRFRVHRRTQSFAVTNTQ